MRSEGEKAPECPRRPEDVGKTLDRPPDLSTSEIMAGACPPCLSGLCIQLKPRTSDRDMTAKWPKIMPTLCWKRYRKGKELGNASQTQALNEDQPFYKAL